MVLFLVLVILLPAHKLYAIRVRLVNSLKREVKWVTVAYVPVVKTLKEPAGKERARERRAAILQRVLYLVLRSTIVAGNEGVSVRDARSGRSVVAFPRVLAYICDQPEERAVLCLKGGQCERPCSLCDVRIDKAGSSDALTAKERDVVATLERQYEAACCRRQSLRRQQRTALEAVDSSNGYVPALACMAGLSTAPHLLFRMVGFDILHVRQSALLFALLVNMTALVLHGGSPMADVRYMGLICVFALLAFSSRTQVLDLGVTRLLVHRVIKLFPFMCAGSRAVAGSLAATKRVAFQRLKFMGRRSRACKADPGYVERGVEADGVDLFAAVYASVLSPILSDSQDRFYGAFADLLSCRSRS